MSSRPLISVVIPTYNRASLVPTSIESVLTQTHHAHEIIVIDDGSSDNTSEVLARYGDRIRVICQSNQGLSGARNTGIHAATAEWVAFLDDDDEYTSDRLARAVVGIMKHPEVDVHTSNTLMVAPDGSGVDLFKARGRPTSDHMVVTRPLSWVLGGCFFAQSSVIRRRALHDAGLFRKTFYEDMDIYVRLARRAPWVIDGRCSLRLIRRSADAQNLSALWRSLPLEKYQALVRIHREAKTMDGLDASDAAVVAEGLATNLFELGLVLQQRGETAAARSHLAEAARTFPRWHSRVKCRIACFAPGTALKVTSRRRRGPPGKLVR